MFLKGVSKIVFIIFIFLLVNTVNADSRYIETNSHNFTIKISNVDKKINIYDWTWSTIIASSDDAFYKRYDNSIIYFNSIDSIKVYQYTSEDYLILINREGQASLLYEYNHREWKLKRLLSTFVTYHHNQYPDKGFQYIIEKWNIYFYLPHYKIYYKYDFLKWLSYSKNIDLYSWENKYGHVKWSPNYYNIWTWLISPFNLAQHTKFSWQEKRELKLWEKIWNHKSSSWVIISANISDKLENSLSLVVDIYKYENNQKPFKTLHSKKFNNWIAEISIPNLESWDYYWEAKTLNDDWITSKVVAFWDNNNDVDFSVYEWYENAYLPNISNNAEEKCKIIQTAEFSNWYKLKHFTIWHSRLKNVWRTELYFNEKLIDIHDTVFYSNGYSIYYYSWWDCDVYSKLSDVRMKNDIIRITYDYFNPKAYSSQTEDKYNDKLTYFKVSKKDLLKIDVWAYAFWTSKYFYVKLNLKDEISWTGSNIASQGFFENIIDKWGSSAWTKLSSYKTYSVDACNIDTINNMQDIYEINYSCNVSHYKSASAIDWWEIRTNKTKTWVFVLTKKDYNLCSYDSKFCSKDFKLLTDLKQTLEMPEVEELDLRFQDIDVWEKIWKNQSGSWIILSAKLNNTDISTNYKLIFEVYKSWSLLNQLETDYINSWVWKVLLDYSWTWSYYWRVRAESGSWFIGNWYDFWDNNFWEDDFVLFEGFEPYPYGYSFVNGKPDNTLLTWNYNYVYNWVDWSISINKTDWTKWEIMDAVFPLSSFEWWEKEYFDAFDIMWLNDNDPNIFKNWNCFWLSLTALTQYSKPELLKKNFPNFSKNIWSWTIFNSIKIQVDDNDTQKWKWLDKNIKAILSHQLYQFEENYYKKKINSYENETPVDILNKLKNNPQENYVISFSWKDNCVKPIFWEEKCDSFWHAVVPYRVEWNKIYIWDSNYPYPFIEDENNIYIWYERHIKIDIENNTFIVPWYERDKFEDIWVVSINEIYSGSTSPIWFNGTDSLYALDWKSEILLIDENGNKTWYKNWKQYNEIPWAEIINQLNSLYNEENKIKYIYLPEKKDNLKVEIFSKKEESYDLMIAWWDYYTKLSNIETNSWQIDEFKTTKDKLEINFDDEKTWDYSLLMNNFDSNWSWTVYIENTQIAKEPQQYKINWDWVKESSTWAISHEIDTNNDWIFDKQETLPAIIKKEDKPLDDNSSWKETIKQEEPRATWWWSSKRKKRERLEKLRKKQEQERKQRSKEKTDKYLKEKIWIRKIRIKWKYYAILKINNDEDSSKRLEKVIRYITRKLKIKENNKKDFILLLNKVLLNRKLYRNRDYLELEEEEMNKTFKEYIEEIKKLLIKD